MAGKKGARLAKQMRRLTAKPSDTRPSPAGLGRGVIACSRNARRLYDDAVALYEQRRYPSAAALAVLAVEEMEKASRLHRVALLADEAKLREEWNALRKRHPEKLRSALGRLVGKNMERWGNAKKLLKGLHHRIDGLKERALYVEHLGRGEWSEPQLVVDRWVCELTMTIALMLMLMSGSASRAVVEAIWKDTEYKTTNIAKRVFRWTRSPRARQILDAEWGDFADWINTRAAALDTGPSRRSRGPGRTAARPGAKGKKK